MVCKNKQRVKKMEFKIVDSFTAKLQLCLRYDTMNKKWEAINV